jgi:hypothetical protein
VIVQVGEGVVVPDEGDVDPEAAVDGGAVEAEEDAVGDGGPGGVLGVAVEAHLYEGGGTVRSRAGLTLFSGLALRRRKTAFLSV